MTNQEARERAIAQLLRVIKLARELEQAADLALQAIEAEAEEMADD